MLLDLEGSITTQELAENFTVSVRTIKYDLEDIRAWFEQHDETLYSKRNKGIWLDLPDSKRLLLKNEIMKFAGKWMELENIILSEVTQSQKNSHNMYSLISGY